MCVVENYLTVFRFAFVSGERKGWNISWYHFYSLSSFILLFGYMRIYDSMNLDRNNTNRLFCLCQMTTKTWRWRAMFQHKTKLQTKQSKQIFIHRKWRWRLSIECVFDRQRERGREGEKCWILTKWFIVSKYFRKVCSSPNRFVMIVHKSTENFVIKTDCFNTLSPECVCVCVWQWNCIWE